MSLITLLVVVLVACVVLWAVHALLTAFGVGDPIRTVIYVVIVLIVLVWFLQVFGLLPPLNLR